MEAEQRRGKWRGPLHGIPIALKDNIDTAGIRTTAASELFKDRVPSEDAEVVRRLNIAGEIPLGKDQSSRNGLRRNFVGQLFRAQFTIPGRWIGFRADRQAVPPPRLRPISVLVRSGTDTAGSVRGPACYLRNRRVQAYLRAGEYSRSSAALLDSGSCRPAVQDRSRTQP